MTSHEETYEVEVDVALARPPRVDATVFVTVAASTRTEAELVACQIAQCDRRVVMAVGSRVTSGPGTE